MAKFVIGSRKVGHAAGARLGAFALFLLPLAGVLAGCGPDAPADGDPDNDLIVLSATPTNGQETKNDLSDPELDNRITVKFTTTPARSTMIDDTNAFNGLTPYVQMLDQTFARVKGTPSIDPDTHAFLFEPENSNLVNGQYTLTVSKFVTTPTGNLLNAGVEDFSTSFTVGTDVYPPVVRNTSPASNQSEVTLFNPIVITFNESLDPATCVLGQTVFVQDGGTNPPTQQNGTLLLKRDGFDLVFIPDPCTGLTPGTTIVVRMLGTYDPTNPPAPLPSTPVYIKDKVGNGLVGDSANNYEVSFQFNTKGAQRLYPTFFGAMGSPRIGLNNSSVAFVSSNKETIAFEMGGVRAEYIVNFALNPIYVQQILATSGIPTIFTVGGIPVAWAYVGSMGGDFRIDFEKAGEAVIDWRVDPLTLLTYIYQVDEGKEAVIIADNSSKVQGKFKGLGTPKGIGISGPGAAGNNPFLYVTNYSQATLTGIPLGLIQPGKNICTAVQELNDDASKRVYMQTGRNPSGVAAEYFGTAFGVVVNQADNEIQMFDLGTLKDFNHLGQGTLQKTYQVGANPIDAGWSPPLNGGAIIFCYVSNLGDINEPNGSVSLWWNNTSLNGLFNSLSGAVAATVTDGLTQPGRPTSDPLRLQCWVPNTGSDDVSRLDIAIIGGFTGSAVSATVGLSKPLGLNPTSVTWTGYPTGNPVELCFATLAGLGQVAVWEKSAAIGPVTYLQAPGCRYTYSHWVQ
jgi:hypothetical protein